MFLSSPLLQQQTSGGSAKPGGVQQNKNNPLTKSSSASSAPLGQSCILPLSDKELLKEWDFDRFFNNLNLNAQSSSTANSSESTKEKSDKSGGDTASRLRKHKRNGSVDVSALPGLRRENSDFSLLLPRHSANIADHIRSTASGAGAGAVKKTSVHPPSARSSAGGVAKSTSIPEVKAPNPTVPTPSSDVASRRSASSLFSSFSKKINSGEWKPTRPRRERTDGDIILKNRSNVWEMRKSEVERRSELRSDTLTETLASRRNSSTLLSSRNRHSFIYDDHTHQVRQLDSYATCRVTSRFTDRYLGN